jgi:hypothetical protein
MKKTPQNKPASRNPVATGASLRPGAGAHKDKKAAIKRGDKPKHKKSPSEVYEELDKKLNKLLSGKFLI